MYVGIAVCEEEVVSVTVTASSFFSSNPYYNIAIGTLVVASVALGGYGVYCFCGSSYGMGLYTTIFGGSIVGSNNSGSINSIIDLDLPKVLDPTLPPLDIKIDDGGGLDIPFELIPWECGSEVFIPFGTDIVTLFDRVTRTFF